MTLLAVLLSVATAAEITVLDDGPRHHASVVLGASASIPISDPAWGPGFAQRLSAEVAMGPVSAFTFDFEHARVRAADADALFPDAAVPADAVAGHLDTFSFDAGPRIGIDLRRPEARLDHEALHAVPYVRFGVVGSLTRARLEAPAFAGTIAMPGALAGPGVSVGAGCNVRIKRWFALNPGARMTAMLVQDPSEDGGKDVWAVAWRLAPGLDVSFDF
jgi:hypothetical protein